ncbi:TetR/AcrR family transcriptional regulator [Bacillaceae bacterium]
MTIQKNDPRVLRTRQLLQDAFTSLMNEKDFKNITVRDITEKAKVNRATFYAHFKDKYELLDFTISNTFKDYLKQRLNCHDVFNQEAITNIFLVMCDYHEDLSSLCQRTYQSLGPIIERKIIEELQNLIFHLLLKGNKNTSFLDDDRELLKTVSTMLSWSIYGTAYTWNNDGRKISAEELISKTIPIIMNGVGKLIS